MWVYSKKQNIINERQAPGYGCIVGGRNQSCVDSEYHKEAMNYWVGDRNQPCVYSEHQEPMAVTNLVGIVSIRKQTLKNRLSGVGTSLWVLYRGRPTNHSYKG